MQALLECRVSDIDGRHAMSESVITKEAMLSQIQSMAHTRTAVWRQLGLEIYQHAFSNTTRGGVVVEAIFVKYQALDN